MIQCVVAITVAIYYLAQWSYKIQNTQPLLTALASLNKQEIQQETSLVPLIPPLNKGG